MKGTDHRFSLEPQGLRKLVRDLKRTRMALGDGIKKGYTDEVEPIRKMGKSLVAAADLPAGHVLREEDVAAKSPGGGLPPYELDKVVGCRLNHPVSRDMQFTFELLDKPAEDEAPPAPTERTATATWSCSPRPRSPCPRTGEPRRPRRPRGGGHGGERQARGHVLRRAVEAGAEVFGLDLRRLGG